MQPYLVLVKIQKMYFGIPWLSGAAEREIILIIPSSDDA